MARGGSSAAPCLIRASAVYRPAGPDPTTATLSVSMSAILHLPGWPAGAEIAFPPAPPPGYAADRADLVAQAELRAFWHPAEATDVLGRSRPAVLRPAQPVLAAPGSPGCSAANAVRPTSGSQSHNN